MAKDACSVCGATVARVAASAPAIVCHACRAEKRRTTHAPPPSKCGTCAECGCLMWRGKGSLPQGEAVCLTCRRARVREMAKFKPELRSCVRCRQMYEATRGSQKYCPPCREKRPGFGRKRGPRLSSSQRGYGAAHLRERAKWKLVVDAGRADCCLCGDPIEPGTRWHLDHTPDRTAYRGPAHAACNQRDGARRGRAKQDMRASTTRQW